MDAEKVRLEKANQLNERFEHAFNHILYVKLIYVTVVKHFAMSLKIYAMMSLEMEQIDHFEHVRRIPNMIRTVTEELSVC